MDVRPLLNESDLDWALAEIGVYFDDQPELGTAEAARFDVLAALIENYEDRHWPIDPPAPARLGRRMRNYRVHAKQLTSVQAVVSKRAA